MLSTCTAFLGDLRMSLILPSRDPRPAQLVRRVVSYTSLSFVPRYIETCSMIDVFGNIRIRGARDLLIDLCSVGIVFSYRNLGLTFCVIADQCLLPSLSLLWQHRLGLSGGRLQICLCHLSGCPGSTSHPSSVLRHQGGGSESTSDWLSWWLPLLGSHDTNASAPPRMLRHVHSR